jgi:hypothetical protein
MRTLLIASVLTIASPAWAQSSGETPTSCVPSSHIDKVAVTMADGRTLRGSLLCLGVAELMLAERSGVSRFRLDEVWKVQKTADPVWDGALKGAAVALVPLVFGCPAECVLRSAAAYGLLGLAIDAVDTNRDAVFNSSIRQHASAGLRVRF